MSTVKSAKQHVSPTRVRIVSTIVYLTIKIYRQRELKLKSPLLHFPCVFMKKETEDITLFCSNLSKLKNNG